MGAEACDVRDDSAFRSTAIDSTRIHSAPVQKGFIKAEIVSFDELDVAGSTAEAKAAGKVRLEGQDYFMADGDVVESKFNV